MRYFHAFSLIVCLISCKVKSDLMSITATEVVNMTCPENGMCSFEILKNKTLQIKTDNFGSKYPEIAEGNLFVLKFEYKKHGNSNYQDSGYREEIFIELDVNNLEIETENLKDRKIYFARWCYCKGQTGYYQVNQGKLAITKKAENNYQLQLSFKVEEVPQIINEIKHTFSIQ